MGNFRRDGGSRFNRGQRGSDNRNRGPVTMHQAICDQCGDSCEVPFRPTGEKPIYCSTCFGGKNEDRGNRGGGRFSSKKFNSYKPSAKTNFGGNASIGNNDELKQQLVILNAKMDQLVKAIEAMASTKPLVEEKKANKPTKTISATKVKKSVKKASKKTKK